jgi:tetratricopeptide (TPR) repeat protein
MLGAIKENLSDFNSAIDAYKNILRARPKDVMTMLNIAACYKNLNQFPTARSFVMKALEAEPGNGSAYLRLGEVYEAAAETNSRGKEANYSDKLVFTIAYGQYKKASESNDYSARENANRKINYLENNLIVPQKSDWFMH